MRVRAGSPIDEHYRASHKPSSLDKSYEYSNLGAGLLGELAAQAAGLSYADALERDVFKPLGLNDTQVDVSETQADRMAQGFSQGADMPRWSSFDALAGAGAVVSSAADLLHFARLTLNPDQAGAMADTLRAVIQPQGEGKTGLGWHRKMTQAGTPLYWHNGGTGGLPPPPAATRRCTLRCSQRWPSPAAGPDSAAEYCFRC